MTVDVTESEDCSLDGLEFVAFDIETTGISAFTERVVEIGAVRFRADGTEIDRFERLVNPGRPIPPQVIRVHGITNEMVKLAPKEDTVVPAFLEFLGDASRTVLMAHNASFDVSFLELAIRRSGLKQPTHDVLDTVAFARRRFRGLPSYALSSLVSSFGVGDSTNHRGLSDAIALKTIFCKLLAVPPQLATIEELKTHINDTHRFQDAPRPRQSRRYSGSRSRGRRPWQATRREIGSTVSVDDAQQACVRVLTDAVRDGCRVWIVYDGGRTPGNPRMVRPIQVVGSANTLYLVAECEATRIEKQYRIDRIREAVLVVDEE